jgi:hypothetical protein
VSDRLRSQVRPPRQLLQAIHTALRRQNLSIAAEVAQRPFQVRAHAGVTLQKKRVQRTALVQKNALAVIRNNETYLEIIDLFQISYMWVMASFSTTIFILSLFCFHSIFILPLFPFTSHPA